MVTPELIIPKYVGLKNHQTLNERWLQDRLHQNPELLGLGDVRVRDRERRQPTGGRLDLLLEDRESGTRYEVEIQLGAVDESHIIRTIEYWDIERRRYPQYEHVAVIVAEEVTGRFLNVISLLNGQIPLIAIQMKGVEVDGAFTLIATRVVDLARLGTEEEDEGETVGRPYWESYASKASMQIFNKLVELVHEVDPAIQPKYNKSFIGLSYDGRVRNFMTWDLKKSSYVLTAFRIPREEDTTIRLDESGLATVSYDSRDGYYRVRVRKSDLDEHLDLLRYLIREAHRANPAT